MTSRDRYIASKLSADNVDEQCADEYIRSEAAKIRAQHFENMRKNYGLTEETDTWPGGHDEVG